MSTRNLDYLFRPRSVAVIGASNEPNTIGAVVMRNLLDGGFSGPILPVSMEHDTVAGVLAYRTVSEMTVTPDLAVICSPRDAIPRFAADLVARGTRGMILLTAGLQNVPGDDNADSVLQRTLREARRYLARVVGPGGVGIAVPSLGLNASLAPSKPRSGSLALLCQSTAVTTALLDWATSRDIGFSHVVSFGESADVDVADVLDYLGSDPQTRALLLYVESIGSARKFMSAARAAARNKPVIVLKPRAHRERRRQELSNDGGSAGADEVFDAAVRRAGMLRVESFPELFAAAEALARARPPRGDRIAVLTNGKSLGSLTANALALGDTTLAPLTERTARELQSFLPPGEAPTNPVDLADNAPAQQYAGALQTLLLDSEVDAVLLVHAPSAIVAGEEVAQACLPVAMATERTVLSCWVGGQSLEEARRLFVEAGLPTYPAPESAARALAHLVEFRRNQSALRETPPSIADDFEPDVDAARRIVTGALSEGRARLTELEAKSLLLAYGIPVVETNFAASTTEAVRIADELGYPVALKVVSPDVVHRSEVAGVMVNLEDGEEVRLAARDIAKRLEIYRPGARLAGYSVQRMIRRRGAVSPRTSSVELALGITVDAAFGPVIHLDQGGAAARPVRERTVALPPLNVALAADLVSRSRVSRLLAGDVGRPPADIDALHSALVRLSQLVSDVTEIAALTIDPLFADQKGVLAMEARVQIRAASTRSTSHLAIRPYPRELEEPIEVAGQPVLLRPIRGEDGAEHEEFLSRIDPEDLRFRFGGKFRQLPQSELARMTQIDYEREMAFIATLRRDNRRPETIGEARVSVDPDGTRAELAIVVRSDFQGRGLGRVLAEKMVRYCREHGIGVLYGLVNASNSRMLGLARSLGFETEHRPEDRTAVISLDLQRRPDPPRVKLF